MPAALERIRRLAWLLDNSIPIPGTRMRVGLDPILGLIPGVGDAAGMLLSGYIVVEAARLGASRATLLRMGWNVLVESVIGVVPLAGDLFDAGWKANARNVALLERSAVLPDRARRNDRGFMVGLAVAAGTLFLGITGAAFLIIRWLIGL